MSIFYLCYHYKKWDYFNVCKTVGIAQKTPKYAQNVYRDIFFFSISNCRAVTIGINYKVTRTKRQFTQKELTIMVNAPTQLKPCMCYDV